MSAERRKARRQELHALLAVGSHAGRVSSTLRVLDISETGARLEVTSGEVPDKFTLTLSRNGAPGRPCHTVWRDGPTIGVIFRR